MKSKCIMLLLSVIILASCVTDHQRSTYIKYSEFPFYGIYKVGTVKVNVDFVDEITISEQIHMIVNMYLDKKQRPIANSDEVRYLDVIINERSFIYNVDFYNSVYIACILRGEDETIYAREVDYINQNKSITLATVQNKILNSMLNRLLPKIYRYEKNFEKKAERAEKRLKKNEV
jgi:hypothetical protein